MKAGNSRKQPSMASGRPAILLMALTIVLIAAFQIYWLQNTYSREKKTLAQKANFLFRESLMKLQASAFRFQEFNRDSTTRIGIGVSSSGKENIRIEMGQTEALAGLAHELGKRVGDTISAKKTLKSTIIFSDEKSNILVKRDTTLAEWKDSAEFLKGKTGIVRFLYSLDSLQDTLRKESIDSAVRAGLEREKIKVPFTVVKTPGRNEGDFSGRPESFPPMPPNFSQRFRDMPEMSKVTIGFSQPNTYELKLGNTLPYLLNRLLYPILISVFLVGVTLVSLLFLYRNLERQRRLTAMKNDFISNVTHELKTPIATVGVAIEALKNFNAISDPARTKEYLDISQNELNRLSMLVDKVLKLSMFENKELELRKETVDLRQLVDEVVSSFGLQFEKFRAQCRVDMEGTNFQLTADKMHITSVLYNLVDNALKYAPVDPRITIHLKDLGANLELSVNDNGVGIPAEYRDKVFEKFFRVPAGDTHNVKGYGLGLSYVAEVVARHGGRVDLQSESGKGTTFTINLPRENG